MQGYEWIEMIDSVLWLGKIESVVHAIWQVFVSQLCFLTTSGLLERNRQVIDQMRKSLHLLLEGRILMASLLLD